MRKKSFVSFLFWLLILSFLLVLVISQTNIFTLAVILTWVILPILSWVLNYYSRKHLKVRIIMPPTASKKEEFQGKIVIKNSGIFSVGCIYCQIYLENRLTGEIKKEWIQLSSIARGNTERDLVFKAVYCGYIHIKIDKMFLMDWFGFLPVKVKLDAIRKCSVIPDTFSPDVVVTVSSAQSNDSDSWSQVHKGSDQTEVFALRDYVPGDSLKQIHWKLSFKLNQLIVKEASLPTEKSLLLFWDKKAKDASPKEMDAMAEVVSSVAQALESQGVLYKLGWTEGEALVLEDVEQQEQLLPLIPRMIKTGAQNGIGSTHSTQENQGGFGKIIYFAKSIPESVHMFTFSELVMVICGQQQDSQWKTINYMADTYAEDLQKIEL